MKIKVRLNAKNDNLASVDGRGQTVDFLYLFNGNKQQGQEPTQIDYTTLYDTREENDGVFFMNYSKNAKGNIGQELKSPTGIGLFKVSRYNEVSIYKREVWDYELNNTGGITVTGGEALYHPVIVRGTDVEYYDYNIANGRTYEYVAYPYGYSDAGGAESQITAQYAYIKTRWNFWSVTELHPDPSDPKHYTASPSDVWLFKYNMQPGEQTYNMKKTQQENLSRYPKVSVGTPNYVGSTITCLLGSEFVSYDLRRSEKYPFYENNSWYVGEKNFSGGGYVEQLRYSQRLTSNQKCDMLNAWRKVCSSGNPKLIKDIKGQKFLAQIISASNTPNQNVAYIPDSVTFQWIEIGDADAVTITSEYSKK